MHALSRTSMTRLSRRASLVTLGAASLSSAIPPLAARDKKKKKSDVNKRCKPQVDQCEAIFNIFCNGNLECLAGIRCCESLSTCDFNGFATCLDATQN